MLEYEAMSFVPFPGEVVPCRMHGYCTVEGSTPRTKDAAHVGPSRRRRRRDAIAELDDFLKAHPITSVHVLRRKRFTLRILMSAEAGALLDVDVVTGEVRRRGA